MLLEVEREGAYANLVLQKLVPVSGLGGADVALLTELVYGALRWRNRLDWVIDRFSKTPAAGMNQIVRNILRLGVYQLLFLERVPVSAACNESVKLAKRWRLDGLAGFVNGLLRNVARNRQEITYPPLAQPVLHISVKYSHPAWLVERWLQRFGLEETIALCRCNNQPPPVVLRCNTLKIKPDELCRQLERDGIAARPSPLLREAVRVEQLATSLTDTSSFQNGCCTVQDESSMLAAIVLRPRAGALVIDACGGPGGKTAHLAQIMENRGRLIAFDIHAHRLRLIRDACDRLGVTIVETLLCDAADPPAGLLGTADYLLVDAPCSGLGVIRRRPDLRWRLREQDLPLHAQQQLRILDGACKCVKPGGAMVYSTCSTEPEENGGVIARFLEGHADWQPADITPLVPPAFLVSPGDGEQAKRGCLQLLPHRHGTDGFFVAALVRSGM